MSKITDLQVNLIRGDLRQGGIEMTDLADDLLDHICCGLELALEAGKSFDEAYPKIKEEVCPNGYAEIQQETSYLLTLKFNKMRKISNILGVVGGVGLLLGSFFKMMHWPGAGLLLVLGGVFMSLVYMPFTMVMELRNTDVGNSRLRIIAGHLSGIILVLGVLFKLMHWPAANILITSGLGAFLLGFTPLFLYKAYKESKVTLQPFTTGVWLITGLCMLFFLFDMGYSRDYEMKLATISDDIMNNVEAQEARNNLWASQLDNPNVSQDARDSIKQLEAYMEDADSYIKSIKLHFLEKLIDGGDLPENKLDPSFAAHFNGYMVQEVIFDHAEDRSGLSGKELQKKMQSFRDYYMEMHHGETLPPTLNFDDRINQLGDKEDWLEYHFRSKSMFGIYASLGQMQLELAQLHGDAMARMLVGK